MPRRVVGMSWRRMVVLERPLRHRAHRYTQQRVSLTLPSVWGQTHTADADVQHRCDGSRTLADQPSGAVTGRALVPLLAHIPVAVLP